MPVHPPCADPLDLAECLRADGTPVDEILRTLGWDRPRFLAALDALGRMRVAVSRYAGRLYVREDCWPRCQLIGVSHRERCDGRFG